MLFLERRKEKNFYTLSFYAFLIITTLLRLFCLNRINLSPDEAYYWQWSRSLQLSYYDHPPLTAYLIFLTTSLGGDSEFFVRLSSVGLSVGIFLVVFILARDLFSSERVAFYSSLLLNATLFFSLGSVIITPDTPLAFFVILTLFFFYRAVSGGKKYYWYLSGGALGLALLSKYTAFLLFPSLLLYLFSSSERRKWLARKEPYLFFLLSLFIFFPVLIWNYQHNFVSFRFQVGHGFANRQVSFSPLKGFSDFIASQILLLTPFIFLLLIQVFVWLGYKFSQKKIKDNYLYLFLTSFPLLLFFFLLSLRSKIEGNWPAFAYLTAFIALSGFYFEEDILPWGKKIFAAALSLGFVLVIAFHLLAVYPPGFILRNSNLAERIYGWSELGARVKKIMGQEKAEGRETFILGSRHQIISEIAFYSDTKYQTYQIQARKRYHYQADDLFSLLGKNALYVEEVNRDEHEMLSDYFEEVERLKPLSLEMKGEVVRTFIFYKCYNYQGGLI